MEHTCIRDDGGTPNRRCRACASEKKAGSSDWRNAAKEMIAELQDEAKQRTLRRQRMRTSIKAALKAGPGGGRDVPAAVLRVIYDAVDLLLEEKDAQIRMFTNERIALVTGVLRREERIARFGGR